jgi:hypothetical protein
VVCSEITGPYVSAVADGTIDGDTVRLTFQAVDGSYGEALLRLEDDRTLRGTFTNHALGLTTPARMTR